MEFKSLNERYPIFVDRIRELLDRKSSEYQHIWEDYPMEYIEDLLRDKVIVYMGDKEIERTGTQEDIEEIVILSYMIWLKKQNEHLI